MAAEEINLIQFSISPELVLIKLFAFFVCRSFKNHHSIYRLRSESGKSKWNWCRSFISGNLFFFCVVCFLSALFLFFYLVSIRVDWLRKWNKDKKEKRESGWSQIWQDWVNEWLRFKLRHRHLPQLGSNPEERKERSNRGFISWINQS